MTGVSHGWGETFRLFRHPRVVTMLFLGFSAGIPILLIFSSLSLWLREAGAERGVGVQVLVHPLQTDFRFEDRAAPGLLPTDAAADQAAE